MLFIMIESGGTFMATISKDTLIGDLIRLDQGTIPILMYQQNIFIFNV